MLISIIVPIYNVENYIEECINSLINQSYTNIEIVIVNDGSTDNSYKKIEGIIFNDSRIKYIYKENGGLSSARNCGIENCSGDLITFVDSDDYVDKDYILTLYKTMKEVNCDVVVCQMAKLIDNKLVYDKNEFTQILNKEEAINRMYGENCINFITSQGILYKKDVISNIRFKDKKLNEDEFTTYKFYLNSKKIVYINNPLYIYRIRSGSIMTSKYNLRRLDSIDAYKERLQILKNNNIDTLETHYAFCCLLSFHHYMLKKNGFTLEKNRVRKEFLINYDLIFKNVNLKRKLKLLILKYWEDLYHNRNNY